MTKRSRGAEHCVWGVQTRVWVCAPHLLPSPPPPAAPYVLFTCLSACDRDTFLFIACTFEHMYTPLRRNTESLGRRTRARCTGTPAFEAVSGG